MRAVVTKDFDGMAGAKTKKYREGDEVTGDMAKWAIENGHGEEIEDYDEEVDDAPAPPRPPPKATAGHGGKGKAPVEAKKSKGASASASDKPKGGEPVDSGVDGDGE